MAFDSSSKINVFCMTEIALTNRKVDLEYTVGCFIIVYHLPINA